MGGDAPRHLRGKQKTSIGSRAYTAPGMFHTTTCVITLAGNVLPVGTLLIFISDLSARSVHTVVGLILISNADILRARSIGSTTRTYVVSVYQILIVASCRWSRHFFPAKKNDVDHVPLNCRHWLPPCFVLLYFDVVRALAGLFGT